MTPTPNWLNMGGLASDKFGKPTDDEIRTAEFTGVLRGVQSIHFGKLARALNMRVVTLATENEDEPNFLVIPTDGEEDDDYGRKRKRGTQWADLYPDDPEGEYVCIYDRQMERCYCADFVWRGETERQPCAHILAVLVSVLHPGIMPYVRELEQRNRIAAAVVGEPAA